MPQLPSLPSRKPNPADQLDPTAGRGKVALVTGASSGIGEATVTELLRLGFDVWGAARRVERMTSLQNLGMKTLQMDLTDDASITAGVEQVLEAAGRVDVLVNNAGYGSFGAVETVPLDEARRQFEVNLFAPARLAQLLTPTMREQGSGRIINVSSIGGKIYEPLGAWYHSTKFALEGLSDSLRVELAPFGIKVVVIEPGAIDTEWTGIARQSLLDTTRGTAYQAAGERMARMFNRIERRGGRLSSPPELVGQRIAEAAVVDNPATRYAVGMGAGTILRARKVLPDRAFDAVVGSMGR